MKVSKVLEMYKPIHVTFTVEKDGTVEASIFVLIHHKDNKTTTQRWTRKWKSLEIDVEGFKEVKFHIHKDKETYYSYTGENGFYMNLYIKK